MEGLLGVYIEIETREREREKREKKDRSITYGINVGFISYWSPLCIIILTQLYCLKGKDIEKV